MVYPSRLLPQVNFKKIVCNDYLRQHYLIHYTNQSEIRDPITLKLKTEFVTRRTDHLRDYSNNLLGVFIVDDIYWSIQNSVQKDYLLSEWKIGEGVIPPIVPIDY